MMGRVMPVLQELYNFVERCKAITLNTVHQVRVSHSVLCAALRRLKRDERPPRAWQLAALYHAQQRLYQVTFKYVHLTPVFDGLATLFQVRGLRRLFARSRCQA